MPTTTTTCRGVSLVTLPAIRQYLALLWERYQGLKSKEEKCEVLDEICRNLGVHRKSAIRWMRGKGPPGRGKTRGGGQRVRRYSDLSIEHLRRLWRQMGYIGASRLKEAMVDWLPHYEDGTCSDAVKAELLRMSAATMHRKLRDDKAALRRRMNSGTRRGKAIVTQVPVRNLERRPVEPGHCEVDCVAHCGDAMSGKFVWTVTLTDIVSGWTECEAIAAKNGVFVRQALERMQRRLPFTLQALYSDNGSEFLNHDVIDHLLREPDTSTLVEHFRGRPYRKNDQSYVEQKNYTHVRQVFGYDRVSGTVALRMMNGVYRKEWRLLQNYFLPQAQLIEKVRIGSKIKRRMARPATPYMRLLNHDKVLPETKTCLLKAREGMNPFEVRRRLTRKLRYFARYLNYPWARSYRGKFHDDPSKNLPFG